LVKGEGGGKTKGETEDVAVEPIGLTDVEILFISSNAI
jgi:hypothetical protein